MLKFDQTTFSNHSLGEYGDCARAVVYTLAQRDLNLPHPIQKSTGGWNPDFFEKLEVEHQLLLNFFPREQASFPRFLGRSGISPRGIRHLVVWDRDMNTLFHDPHPSRLGLSTVDGWFVLNAIS